MANTKSSKKGIVTSHRNYLRNQNYKSRMRTAIANTQTAIKENAPNKEELLRETLKIIDKTAAKGVVKKQSAANKKSRLAKFYNSNGHTPEGQEKKATSKAGGAPKKTEEKSKKETTKKTSATKKEKEAAA